MNPWITIAATVAPEVIALVKALIALRTKFPTLTPADINAAVATITASAETAFDDVLAKIAADESAHPKA
jgi:hypothetical protein